MHMIKPLNKLPYEIESIFLERGEIEGEEKDEES